MTWRHNKPYAGFLFHCYSHPAPQPSVPGEYGSFKTVFKYCP